MNKFLARPHAHIGVEWQYVLVVQWRLGYVSFENISDNKNLITNLPWTKFHFSTGFPLKPLVFKNQFLGCPPKDFIFIILRW